MTILNEAHSSFCGRRLKIAFNDWDTETDKGGGAFETPYDRDTIFIAVLFAHGYE